MCKRTKRILAAMMSFSLAGSMMPLTSLASSETLESETAESVAIVFSENEITATEGAEGFEISGTTLKITDSGYYEISGSSSNGNIVVKKGITDVVIVLNDLTLTSETTAPICCNKNTGVEIFVKDNTVNTLNDTVQNASSENEDAENAVIKAKSGSTLRIDGNGILNVNGTAKNGIKGAAEATVTLDEVTLNVTAANHGIAADDMVVVNGGTINITAGNEGIKSEPETQVDETTGEETLVDTESAGKIVLNGGEICVQASGDGVQAYNDVVVENGTIKINSLGDGIQGSNLTINNGTFDITTNGGYTTVLNNSSDSCKGLKAESTITINNGEFIINSADDAVHTNENISLLGGTFDIKTGDDGVHADTSLMVGEIGADDDKLHINIYESYEGLEAATVSVNSGNIYVVASDDGINAAGGSSNGSDPGSGWNNSFRPGGGWNYGFNQGGTRPGNMGQQNATSDYTINMNGGNVYVNCGGDGLDSNGNLNISGGNITVFSAAARGAGSDNAPFDCDGQFALTGGVVFGAGSSQMAEYPTSSVSTQKYITSTSTIEQGKNIVVSDSSSNILFAIEAIKNVNYVMYSSPDLTSSTNYKISATSDVVVVPTTSPTITTKPTETPTQTPVPTEITEPTKLPEPTENIKPTKYPEPSKEAKPTEAPEPSKEAEPTEAPEPTEEAEPTEAPKPSKEAEPTEAPEPSKEAEPTEEPEPSEEAEPSEEPEIIVSKVKISAKVTSKNSSSLIVKWNRADADYYEIYRASSKNGTYKKVKTINNEKTTSYTDNKLECGKTYYYIVKSYQMDEEEICTGESEVIGAKVIPAKTTIKTLKIQKHKITLKWKKVSGVTGYEIYRATSKNGTYKKVKTITSGGKTTYINKNLKTGKKYYYKMRTYKKVNGKKVYSEYSNIKNGKVK